VAPRGPGWEVLCSRQLASSAPPPPPRRSVARRLYADYCWAVVGAARKEEEKRVRKSGGGGGSSSGGDGSEGGGRGRGSSGRAASSAAGTAAFEHYEGDVYMQTNPRSGSEASDHVFARFAAPPPDGARLRFTDCDRNGLFCKGEGANLMRSMTAVGRYLERGTPDAAAAPAPAAAAAAAAAAAVPARAAVSAAARPRHGGRSREEVHRSAARKWKSLSAIQRAPFEDKEAQLVEDAARWDRENAQQKQDEKAARQEEAKQKRQAKLTEEAKVREEALVMVEEALREDAMVKVEVTEEAMVAMVKVEAAEAPTVRALPPDPGAADAGALQLVSQVAPVGRRPCGVPKVFRGLPVAGAYKAGRCRLTLSNPC